MTINDIERLTAAAARIDAYRGYVEEHPNHPIGWFNLAVDLEGSAAYGEARRAAKRLFELDRELYKLLPRRVLDLIGDDASTTPAAEHVVGGYRITGVIAASESHVLYDAVRVSDGQPVTLRRLLDLSHGNARAVFTAELARPRCDGLVAAREQVDDDGTPLLVLDRLHSDTLRVETKSGPLDPGVAVALMRSAAEDVQALHGAGLIDGDLRPDHVLRDDALGDERVVLLGGRTAGAGSPTPSGKLAWQAPEEVAGELADQRTDVYGLGLLLWHLTAGAEPPPLATRNAGLPPVAPDWPGLDAVIARCLARDPAKRYPSAAAVRSALDELLVRKALPPVIGKWKIGAQLGEGAFGRVFAAENAEISGLRAAVKVLHPWMAHDRELRKRFLNEATAASRVDHPGIVRMLDGGTLDDGTCYLAMEQLTGRSLADELAAGPVAPARAVELGRQAAGALAAAHAADLVHRDLKPSNLFVIERDGKPVVKLLDFGVALLRGEPTRAGVPLTSTGRLMGTPEYMAPEQWQTLPDVDGRADVYALGVSLWECLAGKPPFAAHTQFEWQQAHLSTKVPELRAVAPKVSPRLAALITKMMAKDRADRPQTMAAVEAELESISRDGDRTAVLPPSPPPPAPRPFAWKIAAVGVGVGVLATVVALAMCSRSPRAASPPDAGVLVRDAGASIDAPIVAPIDAAIDAPLDATIDAPLDATIDAAIDGGSPPRPRCRLPILTCKSRCPAPPRRFPVDDNDVYLTCMADCCAWDLNLRGRIFDEIRGDPRIREDMLRGDPL